MCIRDRDNIFVLSVLIEKARTNKMKGTCAAFIDMRKAYDMVDREKLWAVLQDKGINGTFLELLKSMYKDSEIWVDINGSRTQDPVKPKRGLKQGCVLSPILFSLYMNDLGRLLQETNLGIDLGDTNISCLMFADDICLIAKDKKCLQTLIDKTQEYAEKYGLEINPDKSEILSLYEEAGNGPWPLRDQEGIVVADLKQVLKYKYLGIPLSFQHKNMFKYRGSNVLIQQINLLEGSRVYQRNPLIDWRWLKHCGKM